MKGNVYLCITKLIITPQFRLLRYYCQKSALKPAASSLNTPITINGTQYQRDEWTNTNDKLLSHIDRNLHNQKYHPLNFIKQRIIRFMYAKYKNRSGNPLFSIFDNFSPIVTVEQNFDQILIPKNHPSRSRSDTYYLNKKYVLRSQTSAHQVELMKSGLDNFVVIGDVYRKDEIDCNHYPVFHQVEAVRLRSEQQVFSEKKHEGLRIFENGNRTKDKQELHTLEAVKLMEHELKYCLTELVKHIFGNSNKNLQYRWVDTYFPFTHPSYELEVNLDGKWLEMLGCGIMEHRLLQDAGIEDKIGWAFGMGLERLAMKTFAIPDIRLFWSQDSGFLSQFQVENPYTPIKYKPISKFPQRINDVSFWLKEEFPHNDFYELVRRIGGNIVEQVSLIDEFEHPKTSRKSRCYRIVYRHMEKELKQEEVNDVHQQIAERVALEYEAELRSFNKNKKV